MKIPMLSRLAAALTGLAVLAAFAACGAAPGAKRVRRPEPTPVIIDTDIGNSTDDLANADGSKMFPRTDADLSDDSGYNLRYDLPLATRFLEEWPREVPVYISPSPVGNAIAYDEETVLSDLDYDDANPIRQTYLNRDCNTGQKMWDHLCVLNAIYPENFEYSPRGRIDLTEDGKIKFAGGCTLAGDAHLPGMHICRAQTGGWR